MIVREPDLHVAASGTVVYEYELFAPVHPSVRPCLQRTSCWQKLPVQNADCNFAVYNAAHAVDDVNPLELRLHVPV